MRLFVYAVVPAPVGWVAGLIGMFIANNSGMGILGEAIGGFLYVFGIAPVMTIMNELFPEPSYPELLPSEKPFPWALAIGAFSYFGGSIWLFTLT